MENQHSDLSAANRTQRLLESGSEIAGGVAGTAVGLVIGGPGGAFAGAALGPIFARTLQHVGAEVAARFLGPRGEARVGATLGFATVEVNRRFEAGDNLRQDGFFDKKVHGSRTAADEVVEGVLWAAHQEHQERKLEYYGILLAGIAFDESVTAEAADYLLRSARELSYRQLGLLALVGRSAEFKRPAKTEDVGEQLSEDQARDILARIQAGGAEAEDVSRLMRARLPARLALEVARAVRESDDPAVRAGQMQSVSNLSGIMSQGGLGSDVVAMPGAPMSDILSGSIKMPLQYRLEPILLAELRDLRRRGIIDTAFEEALDSFPKLTAIGSKLFKLMGLENYPRDVLVELAQFLAP